MNLHKCLITNGRNICPHKTLSGHLCEACAFPNIYKKFQSTVITETVIKKYLEENTNDFKKLNTNSQNHIIHFIKNMIDCILKNP